MLFVLVAAATEAEIRALRHAAAHWILVCLVAAVVPLALARGVLCVYVPDFFGAHDAVSVRYGKVTVSKKRQF